MNIIVSENLKELVKNAGVPVYIVGGAVRNAISGLGQTDIDLSGPVIASALKLPKEAKVRMVNFRLGTSVISYKGENYEYTPFRTEKYSAGGAHSPTEIAFTTDIKQDAYRRDFTVNSIYYEINTAKVYDFFGGIQDAERKILRAFNPDFVFSADGLRILRLVRIASETGFKLEGETAKTAMQKREFLADISAERKAVELMKILLADQKNKIEGAHYRGLKLLQKMKLLSYLIPQLEDCSGVLQNEEFHKYDVLEHSFQAVKFAAPDVRLAALFHDSGKPYCINLYQNMHGHEKISSNIVLEALGQNGLKMSRQIIDETSRLCLYHMYDMDGKTSEAKVRVFVAQNSDIIEKLVQLNIADKMATGFPYKQEENRFLTIFKKMKEDGTPMNFKELQIDGNALAEIGFSGVDIGNMLNYLWRECVLNPRLNDAQWLLGHAQKKIGSKL